MAGISLKQGFPTRPAYGTRGKPLILWTNYFELTPSNNLVFYRYSASVSPEATGRKLKRVFELLLQDPRMNGCMTDFKTMLISRVKFEEVEVEVIYRGDYEDEPPPNPRPYTIKIQLTGPMEVGQLLNQLKSTQVDPSFDAGSEGPIIQTLNVVLGHYPQTNPTTTTVAGNKYFSFGANRTEFDLGGGLAALRGYFRSVRMGTARLLVNINVSHGVFYKSGPLAELIDIYFKVYGMNLLQLEKFLKKVRVEKTHLPIRRNRNGEKIPQIKTIIGLATTTDGRAMEHPPQIAKFAANPKEVKFWLDNATETTTAKAPARKGKGTAQPAVGYISVFDFFQKGI